MARNLTRSYLLSYAPFPEGVAARRSSAPERENGPPPHGTFSDVLTPSVFSHYGKTPNQSCPAHYPYPLSIRNIPSGLNFISSGNRSTFSTRAAGPLNSGPLIFCGAVPRSRARSILRV